MCLVTVSGAGHIKECAGGVRVKCQSACTCCASMNIQFTHRETCSSTCQRQSTKTLQPLSLTLLFSLSLTLFYLFSPLFLLPSLIDMNRKLISGILPALPIFVAYFCAPLRTLQSCRKGISQLHMMITLNMTLYTAAHTPPPHTHTHLKNCQSPQKLSHKSRAVSRSLPTSLSLSFCAGGSVIDEHFTFVISVFKLTEC